MFIILLSLLALSVSSLSSSKSPGDQFDLTKWKLTLPDSKASEKSPSQLESDYEGSYFYTASDGSMTFYVKGSGGTTSGSNYPRSELRQLCNPGKGDRYNWHVSTGTNYVEGQYKIGKLDSSSRKVVIQQIHAYDGPPLVKIQYQSGKVYALYKTNKAGSTEKKVTLGSVSGKFKLKTQTNGGYLKIWLNGSRKVNVKVSGYWSSYRNYFKAGNYLQSSSNSAYAYIHMYYLKVSSSSASSNCKYTSSFTEEEGPNHTNPMEMHEIIGIIVGIFVFIICGVSIYFYWRKRKAAKASQIKLEDNPKESGDIKGGDTPMMESDGADTPNSTGAYDMDEIEITVPVDDNKENENDEEQK